MVDLWLQVQTQWKSAGFGPMGMDWPGVRCVMDWLGIEATPELFRQLAELERDTLKAWTEEHGTGDSEQNTGHGRR